MDSNHWQILTRTPPPHCPPKKVTVIMAVINPPPPSKKKERVRELWLLLIWFTDSNYTTGTPHRRSRWKNNDDYYCLNYEVGEEISIYLTGSLSSIMWDYLIITLRTLFLSFASQKGSNIHHGAKLTKKQLHTPFSLGVFVFQWSSDFDLNMNFFR